MTLPIYTVGLQILKHIKNYLTSLLIASSGYLIFWPKIWVGYEKVSSLTKPSLFQRNWLTEGGNPTCEILVYSQSFF